MKPRRATCIVEKPPGHDLLRFAMQMARGELYSLGFDAPCNTFSWAAPLTQTILMFIAVSKGVAPMQLFYGYSTSVGALLGTAPMGKLSLPGPVPS
jgi:hypothetical protein